MARHLVDEAHRRGASTILTGVGAEMILDSSPWSIADRLREGRWVAAYREARRWAEATHTNVREVLFRRGVLAYVGPAGPARGAGDAPAGRIRPLAGAGSVRHPPWVLPRFAGGADMGPGAGDHPPVRSLPGGAVVPGGRPGGHAGRLDLLVRRGAAGPAPQPPVRRPPCGRLRAWGSLRRSAPLLGEKEPVLREAMKGVLPEPIRTRRHKRGFDDLYSDGLTRALPDLEAMIGRSKVGELDLFDLPLLTRVLREHALGIGDAMVGSRVNASLAVLAWYDQLGPAMRSVGEPSEIHRLRASDPADPFAPGRPERCPGLSTAWFRPR